MPWRLPAPPASRCELDGKDLVVSAASEPPADILDMLRRHKADLVEYLRASPCRPHRPLPPSGANRPGEALVGWGLEALPQRPPAGCRVALGETRGAGPRPTPTSAASGNGAGWARIIQGPGHSRACGKGDRDPSPPPAPQAASWSTCRRPGPRSSAGRRRHHRPAAAPR